MKKLMGIVVALSVVAAANAATDSVYASEWGTIQPGGPRSATSGNRFLNAEGSSFGSFASDAPVRFDISSIKAGFDATYGAGQWQVDAVTVTFDNAPAGFSVAGPVDLWHLEDDAVGITNGQAGDGPDDDFSGLTPSPLVYGNIPTSPLLTGTETKVVDDFIYTTSGARHFYDILDAGALATVAADILADDKLTFALVAEVDTAATYKGNDFDGAFRPQVFIEASLIPEPASLILLSLAGLLIRRR